MRMRNRLVGPMIAMAVVVSLASPVAGQEDDFQTNRSLAAETAAAKKKAEEKTPIPRKPDGKPNLEGTWNPGGAAQLNILEEHLGGFGVLGGPSMIVDPPDGKIPYQPWALAERDRKRRPENHTEDNRFKCILMGAPRNMLFAFTVFQTPGYFVRVGGETSATSITRMDGSHSLPDHIRLWMGESVGHWEGDTLVIDTTNLNGKFWLAIGGDFMSDAAHVVERITMINRDTLWWEATITDPKVFTRPWTMKYPAPHVRANPRDFDDEDSCHEGNVDAVHFYNNRDQYYGRAKK